MPARGPSRRSRGRDRRNRSSLARGPVSGVDYSVSFDCARPDSEPRGSRISGTTSRLLPLLTLLIAACGLDSGSDGADDTGGAPATRASTGGASAAPRGGTLSGGTRSVATGGVSTGGVALLVMGGFYTGTGGFSSGGVRTALTGGFSSGGLRTGGTSALRTGGTRATGGTRSGPITCNCACFCNACSGPYVKTCAAGDTTCATCRGPCVEYCAATPTCGGQVLASGTCGP
jgi:hypothetical protein